MLIKIWKNLFLEERPSLGLAFFRIAVAITIGFHVIPTFFQLSENFYHTAFKSYNLTFFPESIVQLVQKSPDALVSAFVAVFLIVWFCFLIGLWTRLSCILLIVTSYYFYALNCFQIGTLSWDILLVTLFLMSITSYPGDYFSVDCLKRGDPFAYQRRRPFFIQRLLQMQIACTYFYTALYKITPPHGNWFTGNPIYYLMNYPPLGVTKNFLLKDFFATRPELCYVVGVLVVVVELLMPFLLFFRPTRRAGIILGIFFHLILILTLDVPAIFFFLFPAQLLLFIDPKEIIRSIDHQREVTAQSPRGLLLFDGNCHFCQNSVRQLRLMDLFNTLNFVDYNSYLRENQPLPANLSQSQAASQMHLIETDGTVLGGYFVFRRLCLKLPMMYPFLFLFYFPGSGILGPVVYQWIAKNRYLFHANKTCHDNRCFINNLSDDKHLK